MIGARMAQPLLLVHGLWMQPLAMRWWAQRLRLHGFSPDVVGYHSLREAPEAIASRLAAAIAARPGTAIVAHSLGGLLAVCAAARVAAAAGRIVCLGSPLAGSRAATALATRLPGGARLLGPQRALLERGLPAVPDGLCVGMVAGIRAHGLGRVVARLPRPNDGTVALVETALPGLAARVTVAASHSGLLWSGQALAQALAFLRDGRFRPDPAGADV